MTPEMFDRIARRMIVDVLLQAESSYWLRRAEDFAKVGNARCDAIAQALRNKAALCLMEDALEADEWAELLAVELGEAA